MILFLYLQLENQKGTFVFLKTQIKNHGEVAHPARFREIRANYLSVKRKHRFQTV